MQWTVDDAPDHLLITIEGEWLLPDALKMLDETSAVCHARGYHRVLVDCRKVGGLISEVDKFVSGTRIAELYGKVRVAVVFTPGPRVTGFAGSVAARRGGNLCVTTEMNDALRYLDGESC